MARTLEGTNFYDVNYESFPDYYLDFWKRHVYDMLDKKESDRERIQQYAKNNLDNRLRETYQVDEEVDRVLIRVQELKRLPNDTEVIYTQRLENNIFIYKVLRDMHHEVFLNSDDELGHPIDRDGDYIMSSLQDHERDELLSKMMRGMGAKL